VGEGEKLGISALGSTRGKAGFGTRVYRPNPRVVDATVVPELWKIDSVFPMIRPTVASLGTSESRWYRVRYLVHGCRSENKYLLNIDPFVMNEVSCRWYSD